jgi:hypothetical protein
MWRHVERRKSRPWWQPQRLHNQIKSQKTSSYAWHICGFNGHKMTNCPKFIEMHKMFHGKSVAITKVRIVVET